MGTEILGPVVLPDILIPDNWRKIRGTFKRKSSRLLRRGADSTEVLDNKIVFQQDGAGPHNIRIVTNYLNEQFPRRWPRISILLIFFMGIL